VTGRKHEQPDRRRRATLRGANDSPSYRKMKRVPQCARFAGARTDVTANHRLGAVEYAVKVKALAELAREIGIGEALAVIGAAKAASDDERATPRELAAAGRHAYRAQVVADIARFEKEGRARDAVLFVARTNAADKHDPIEVETLKNKFRRWRRAELKRACARLPAHKSNRG
jgi:hypothetical protein